MTKFPPFFDATEILNMAFGGHSNITAVGNNKMTVWCSQNSLVLFTLKVIKRNKLTAKLTELRVAFPRSQSIWLNKNGSTLTTRCSIRSYCSDQRVAVTSSAVKRCIFNVVPSFWWLHFMHISHAVIIVI